jgi:hypothetical protein
VSRTWPEQILNAPPVATVGRLVSGVSDSVRENLLEWQGIGSRGRQRGSPAVGRRRPPCAAPPCGLSTPTCLAASGTSFREHPGAPHPAPVAGTSDPMGGTVHLFAPSA